MSETTGKPHLSVTEARRIRVNLVRVAALAALLGLLMEAMLALGGEATVSLNSLFNHSLWPYMVCMAVAIGLAVTGGWPARAAAFSLVATPAAFLLAKIVQKGLSSLMDSAGSSNLNTPLLIEAGVRAIEYAVLAALLVWLARQIWAGALAHLATGAAVGIVFGLITSILLPPASLLGWAVEELVFPTGCALVVFASETLTRRLPNETMAPNT